MTRQELDEYCDAHEIEMLVADGHDNAILGVVRRFDQTFVLYNKATVIKNLLDNGMTEEQAFEYFEFNISGAWMGDHTPAYLEDDGSKVLP